MMGQPSVLETRLRQMFPETQGARVDRLGMLSDIQREPVWQHLRALHCEVKWVTEDELDTYAADGWQPVIARRNDGSYLFMDREGGRALMSKASAEPA